jgi:mitochondrial import inner membrane translocase subunit TIM44
MIAARRLPSSAVRQYVTSASNLATSRTAQYGRTAAYRRIASSSSQDASSLHFHFTPLSSQVSPTYQFFLRSLHTSRIQLQSRSEAKTDPAEEVRDPPRDAKSDSEASGEQSQQEDAKSGSGEKTDSKQKQKEQAAPPPPHGDKTPWQVFRETLSSEFKASKEWNESTKQLSGSVQSFTESDAVRKAREASEAASKGTSQVLKSTAGVIGKGAAWTWETPVVQGIRKGVNATGRGIEKATRPVRETKAFKDISEAVDDGSSSRYGGWVEKEERRRREEARRAKLAQNPEANAQPMVEDPKCVAIFLPPAPHTDKMLVPART